MRRKVPPAGGEEQAPADRFDRGFPCARRRTESDANRLQRRTWRPKRLGRYLLRRRGHRVEYAPRCDLAGSVDALCPGNVWQVGVLVEQVQGLAVVGHLISAVGPHDNPQCVLVNTGSGFRLAGSEYRWPRHRSANALAGALVVTAGP